MAALSFASESRVNFFIPSSSYFSILRIVIRVRGKAARSYQSSRIPCLLATSRLRSKTFPPLQTDVDTVEKGEMEFWCTVVGENFCSPFERAEESRRRLRRRRRRCLGQMKRESASRHREPLQRESVSERKISNLHQNIYPIRANYFTRD